MKSINDSGVMYLVSKIKSLFVAKTDNYAGSDSAGGSATSAKKLETGRTLQVNLASTASPAFNGTANTEIGVKGILSVSNGGTGVGTTSGLAESLVDSDDALDTLSSAIKDKLFPANGFVQGYYETVTGPNPDGPLTFTPPFTPYFLVVQSIVISNERNIVYEGIDDRTSVIFTRGTTSYDSDASSADSISDVVTWGDSTVTVDSVVLTPGLQYNVFILGW